jgi:hypothetical protein
VFQRQSRTWGGGVCFLDLGARCSGSSRSGWGGASATGGGGGSGTVGRAYVIGLDQFNDVLRQENHGDFPALTPRLLADLQSRGVGSSAALCPHGWYSTVVYLGCACGVTTGGDVTELGQCAERCAWQEGRQAAINGGAGAAATDAPMGHVPLLTFTAPAEHVAREPPVPPSSAYRTIVKAGLLQCGLSPTEADEYLAERGGMPMPPPHHVECLEPGIASAALAWH